MKPASNAAAEDQPVSPLPPASELRPAAAKIDGREALRRVREGEDPDESAALTEAGERYADDEDGSRELDDLRAGRHPLQRGRQDAGAWASFEEKLARIRAQRGA